MCQSAPLPDSAGRTGEPLAGDPTDMPVGWLAGLAGLLVPTEDAEPLADALRRLSQSMVPLIAQIQPGTCMTGDFDPRWR